MSIIPDCRPKYLKDADHILCKKEQVDKKEINPYWWGLLNKEDKEFIKGYDWNTEQVVCNLFDNLDVYAAELKDVGINVDDIDTNIVNGAFNDGCEPPTYERSERDSNMKWYSDYTYEELQKMNNITKTMLLLKEILCAHIESERDMLITSMIDNMDEDAYDEAYNEAMKESVKNKD